jgi:dipeptidyl aminopeptidase/acylaminoacyl peptidase
MTEIAPYGTWKSPISAANVAQGAVGVSYPAIAGNEVWWQERRPSEGGRSTVMAATGAGAEPRELLPAPWNARNRVHEYGGQSYLPAPSASTPGSFDLVFANFADQRLYLVPATGGDPAPLTPAEGGFRFADLVLSPDGREIWCVRETTVPDDGEPAAGFHTGGGMKVRRAIVAVPLDGTGAGTGANAAAAIRVLVSGAQFFAFPTPSPDGTKLAWINWNHPNMPWDGTELRIGPVSGGPNSDETGDDGLDVADTTLIMGGQEESVLSPRWRDNATLYAISDASGWWNLYEAPAALGAIPRPLRPLAEEFAEPLWQLGGGFFEVLGDGRLAVLHGVGELHLGLLDPATGDLADVDLPGIRTVEQLAVSGTTIVVVAGGPSTPWSILRIKPGAAPESTALESTVPEIIKKQAVGGPDPAYLPEARPVQLSAGHNGGVVHALVYAPASADFTGPDGELPPYIVQVHGGPTSHSVPVVSMEKAYFTSRGIGIIDVNYGGSTGYGRDYRNRLRGQWGIVDVADAYTAALGLAESGEADRARLGIRGGSAGGWTALAAVTSGPALTGTKEAVFSAATSYYGVSDLRPFVIDTHDFESRYLDGLIGPLPEADAIYTERAPVGHITELTCPVLLLQGLDDPIVPPSQSEAIAADLAAHGIRYAYITFEGESHGFRKAETVIRSLEAELAFYGEIFGFTPPDVPPLELA